MLCTMKIVVTADRVYVDPSALLKLYLQESESRAISEWRAGMRGPLMLTLHGKLEVVNALGLALHRGAVSVEAHRGAGAAFQEDLDSGRYVQASLLWRATLDRAAELSRAHTPVLGCRSLDVLHVASALTLGLNSFLTFDHRQQRLARAVGLKILSPAGP